MYRSKTQPLYPNLARKTPEGSFSLVVYVTTYPHISVLANLLNRLLICFFIFLLFPCLFTLLFPLICFFVFFIFLVYFY